MNMLSVFRIFLFLKQFYGKINDGETENLYSSTVQFSAVFFPGEILTCRNTTVTSTFNSYQHFGVLFAFKQLLER